MTTSAWKLQLDQAVRYAVSDALASVRYQVSEIESNQNQSPPEWSDHLQTWSNYLLELRALHQQLLNLPSLETAQWLTDNDAELAPTFTPFVNSIYDAKVSVQRVHNWLLSLPQTTLTDNVTDFVSTSAFLERQNYINQVTEALTQLTMLPSPGSEDWVTRYQSDDKVLSTPVT